uniref:Mitochondrial carrier homolog 2 n=1 Tax=Ciona savignyi TaxID=51511 RepID=H2YYM7_CIOSA
IAVGVGMTVVAHPFTYAKVLVQLGHEPLAPVMRRNMFFRKQLQYPSVFAYIKHINTTDGYVGLYRGLLPRIFANASTSITYSLFNKVFTTTETNSKCIYNEDSSNNRYKFPISQTTREMAARCSAIIISQPFHVIAIRTMAEFVGHETIYTNIFTSTAEIYREDGILGFFAGIMPRLASEVITIWLCNLLAHTVNTYVLTDTVSWNYGWCHQTKQTTVGTTFCKLTFYLRQYTHLVVGYVAQIITYPLSVTSTVMAASGTRLRAGNPPCMPVYRGWLECLKDLHKTGASNRGSSMFFRKAAAHLYSASA